MTLAEFHQTLRDTGRYETPLRARPAAAGMLTAWRFHTDVMFQLATSGWHAWQGRFDQTAMAGRSFDILRAAEGLGAVATFEEFGPRAAFAGPVVYAANHMSMLETMLLPGVLTAFGPLAIVLKESLLRYPCLGSALRAIEPIVVSRHNARADLQAVLEQGCAKLAAGTSVLLFPQATRSPVFQPAYFNSLATKLARAAEVPLAPIALQTDFAGLGKWIKDFGPVDPSRPIRFAAGPLIPPGTPARLAQQQCVAFIAARLAAWGLPTASA